jgi:hypothetical protein
VKNINLHKIKNDPKTEVLKPHTTHNITQKLPHTFHNNNICCTGADAI